MPLAVRLATSVAVLSDRAPKHDIALVYRQRFAGPSKDKWGRDGSRFPAYHDAVDLAHDDLGGHEPFGDGPLIQMATGRHPKTGHGLALNADRHVDAFERHVDLDLGGDLTGFGYHLDYVGTGRGREQPVRAGPGGKVRLEELVGNRVPSPSVTLVPGNGIPNHG